MAQLKYSKGNSGTAVVKLVQRLQVNLPEALKEKARTIGAGLLEETSVLLLLRFGCRCRCSSCRSRFLEPVQVMGDAVAIAALGELTHHALRVRCAVAILALRNHLVLGFVTAYARYGLMFSRRRGQEVVGFLVTSHTILVGKIAGVGDGNRHMRLVALLALGGGLLRVVRLVTLGAGRNLAVDVVAC